MIFLCWLRDSANEVNVLMAGTDGWSVKRTPKITCIHRVINIPRMFRRLVIYSLMSIVVLSLMNNLQHHNDRKENVHRPSMQSASNNDETADGIVIQRKGHSSTIPLRYRPPVQSNIHRVGRRFRVDTSIAKRIAESFQGFVELGRNTLENFVFLMAASEDHFDESKDAVAGIQNYFSETEIFYYDIGLSPKQSREVKSWCGVSYRVFNFTAYPPHVRILKKYSWKALVFQEVAKSHGAVMWFDASTRLNTGNVSGLFKTSLANGGIAHVRTAPHSNFAVTHPKTFEFITTDEEIQKGVQQVTSGVILYYNTEKMFRNVLWWWVLCALDPYCMAPIPWVPCDFRNFDRWKEYARCHRYDQSVINILVSNLFGYDKDRYIHQIDVHFERWPTNYHRLNVCAQVVS